MRSNNLHFDILSGFSGVHGLGKTWSSWNSCTSPDHPKKNPWLTPLHFWPDFRSKIFHTHTHTSPPLCYSRPRLILTCSYQPIPSNYECSNCAGCFLALWRKELFWRGRVFSNCVRFCFAILNYAGATVIWQKPARILMQFWPEDNSFELCTVGCDLILSGKNNLRIQNQTSASISPTTTLTHYTVRT